MYADKSGAYTVPDGVREVNGNVRVFNTGDDGTALATAVFPPPLFEPLFEVEAPALGLYGTPSIPISSPGYKYIAGSVIIPSAEVTPAGLICS